MKHEEIYLYQLELVDFIAWLGGWPSFLQALYYFIVFSHHDPSLTPCRSNN